MRNRGPRRGAIVGLALILICFVAAVSFGIRSAQRNISSEQANADALGQNVNSITDWSTMFHMVNAKVGWAAVNSNSRLLRTTDAGHTWRNVSPVSLPATGDPMISACDFLSQNVAYITVSTNHSVSPHGNEFLSVFRTADGGKHWNRTNIPIPAKEKGSVVSMDFINTNEGWMMIGLDKFTDFESSEVAIYHTKDAGASWARVSFTGTRDFAVSQNGLPIEPRKMGLKFMNSSVGWVTLQGWNANPWLYTTSNGGRTWRPVPLELNEVYKHDAVVAYPPTILSNTDAVVPLYYPLTIDRHLYLKNVLFLTSDGGRTWRSSTAVRYSLNGGYGGATDVLDAKHAFIVGGPTLFHTNDGGRSWQGTKLPSGVFRVEFTTPLLGWALGDVGDPRLLRTTDGGRTWHDVNARITG